MGDYLTDSETVFIVDDDPAIRIAMQALMDSVDIKHEIFSSADEFLQNESQHRAGCLVLDIRMPGIGGLDLQEELISPRQYDADYLYFRSWRHTHGRGSDAKRRC